MIKIDYPILLVQVITFLMAVFVLWKFFWGPLTAFMRERQDSIRKEIDDTQRSRQEAVKIEAAYQKLIENIKKERLDILDKAALEGDKERNMLVLQAHEETKRMIENARREIEEEREKTRGELRKEVVSLSVLIAEKILKQSVDGKIREKLVKEFAEDLKKMADELSYRIARAIYRRAKQGGTVDTVCSELASGVAQLESDPGARLFLNHPRIGAGEKKKMLYSVLGLPVLRKLADIALELKDVKILRGVSDSLEELRRNDSDYVYAEATMAEAGAVQRKTLEDAIEKSTGKKTRLVIKADPGIIGGVRLKIGDRVIDATVNARLRRIEERLTS